MRRRQGSIFWSLILISIGTLFLLSNLSFDIRPWAIIAKYWPVLIIFWGLSKLVSYFTSADNQAAGRRSLLTGGDVVLLIFLLVLGTTITKAVSHGFWRDDWGINFNGEDDGFFGDSREAFTFIEEISRPLVGKHEELEILNKYGSVSVSVHDLPEVKVKMEKKIKARDEERAKALAEELKIRVEPRSKGFVITSNRDDLDKEKRGRVQTNFSIWVPRKITLVLSNQYGAVSVDGVAGNHSLDNGYGAVEVQNVDGGLHVENKYGGIRISRVTGDCEVNNKYGAVELDTIGGKTKIDNGYGSVVLKKLKGSVELTHKYGTVEGTDLESTLLVNGRYVEVKAKTVGGDVQITTSYKNVELEDVLGAMSIQAKHGDIHIKSSQPPSKPITIDAEYSGINVTLPKDSRFRIDAYSKYGKLFSEFDSIGSTGDEPDGAEHITATQGEGGPAIKISTSYRDIHLDAS